MQQVQIPKEIEEFLVNLLKESGTLPDTEDLKEFMILDLYKKLEAHLYMAVAEKLSEDQFLTFNKLSQLSVSQGQQFLQDQIPNYKEFYLNNLEEFKKVFMEG